METYAVDMRPTVLIIDGAFFIRRSIYQPQLREMSTSIGIPTGGVYGFLQSLKSTINTFNASSIVVTWEGGHSERRKEVYADYKKREPVEGEPERDEYGMTDYEFYCNQLNWVQGILTALGVHQVRVSGKEGDDVLYQTVHLLGGRKIIVSEDRDFYALVDDDTSVYRPIKKEMIEFHSFKDTGYESPKHYLYGKVLCGDGSDNIPQVAKGVGEGTITGILKNIPENELSPDRILKEAASIGNARCMKLVEAGLEPIERNLNLIDISREKFDIFQLKEIESELTAYHMPNIANANKIMQHLEFNENHMRGIISKLAMMTEYPLHNLINKDYIKSVMIGGIV